MNILYLFTFILDWFSMLMGDVPEELLVDLVEPLSEGTV